MRRFLTTAGVIVLACSSVSAQPQRGGLRTVPIAPPGFAPFRAPPPPVFLPPTVARQNLLPMTLPPVSPFLGRPLTTFGGFGGFYYSPFYSPFGYSTPYPAGSSIQVYYNNVLPPPEPVYSPRGFGYIPPPPLDEHPTTARLELYAPSGAAVWLQGKPVEMGGPRRVFESPELKPGETFTFDVRVRWEEKGKPVEEKRTLTMKAGDRQSLQYLALPPATTRVEQ